MSNQEEGEIKKALKADEVKKKDEVEKQKYKQKTQKKTGKINVNISGNIINENEPNPTSKRDYQIGLLKSGLGWL